MDEDAHVVHEEELKAPALYRARDALPGLGIRSPPCSASSARWRR
ncbi:MAG: hypothetical protein U0Q12_00780 [Vicinamibacterales bacterium]